MLVMDTFVFRFRAMAGDNELQIVSLDSVLAERAAARVIREVERIESKFSRFRSDSIVSEINVSAGKLAVAVDAEVAGLLDYADACFHQSGGLFDITSGVLRRAWNFRNHILPNRKEVQQLLPLIGWQKVTWKNPWLFLPKAGMELDFGGIGKEYAVDRACGLLLEMGVTNCLVNLAGDIRVCGSRAPQIPWRIGIADPVNPNRTWGSVAIQASAAATSGDYERKIEFNGRRYSHLLNPRTGWPTEGLQSVTAFADSCIIAGSITTTAMLMGKKGERYLEKIGAPYIAVTSLGKVIYSPSIQLQL